MVGDRQAVQFKRMIRTVFKVLTPTNVDRAIVRIAVDVVELGKKKTRIKRFK